MGANHVHPEEAREFASNRRQQPFEFCGELKEQTEKAYRVFDGVESIWIPKRLVLERRNLSTCRGRDCVFVIPQWLAQEKGII